MNEQQLMQIIEQIGPQAMLAIIQLLTQLSQEQLEALVQQLAQMAEAEQAPAQGPDQGQQNLYG